MRGRRITFVFFETVVRIVRCGTVHLAIANHLRDDRRCADRCDPIIAANDRNCRHRKTRRDVAIDVNDIRLQRKVGDGALHCEQCRAQDIYRIDLIDLRAADADSQRLRLDISASSARRAAVNFLESRKPPIGRAGSRITAAAMTGPARGPRPTSSTPARIRIGIGWSSNKSISDRSSITPRSRHVPLAPRRSVESGRRGNQVRCAPLRPRSSSAINARARRSGCASCCNS